MAEERNSPIPSRVVLGGIVAGGIVLVLVALLVSWEPAEPGSKPEAAAAESTDRDPTRPELLYPQLGDTVLIRAGWGYLAELQVSQIYYDLLRLEGRLSGRQETIWVERRDLQAIVPRHREPPDPAPVLPSGGKGEDGKRPRLLDRLRPDAGATGKAAP